MSRSGTGVAPSGECNIINHKLHCLYRELGEFLDVYNFFYRD